MKGFLTPALLVSALALTGCELTDEEKEKLDNAAVDLQQLADQIIITYPAKDSEITDSMVTVRADIPASAQAQEVRLLVDGIEIAKDSDGAPWEIQWPAYYFADGSKHTLLLKTITGEGNEVRNNEQFQVTVNETANEALSFSAGVDGTQIQDQNSVTVGFSGFPEASAYEVKYDSKTITTNETEVELTDLFVGTHIVQYRVLHESLPNTPFSTPASIEVLAPILPVLNDPIVKSKDEGYEVTLSWEVINTDDNYEINWGTAGNLTSIGSVSGSNYILPSVELGNYEYTIKRINSLAQESAVSDIMPIGVGVFRTQLGGSQDDRARQIKKSKQGGYLVRATTKSYEVSDTLNGTDDWIIRLNEQGVVLDELVLNTDNPYIRNMYETSDGSVYLVGSNSATKEAVLTKLNSDLELQWDVLFKPEGETEYYSFYDIVEWNNKIYVSASSNSDAYLHEINPVDGSVSDGLTLPSIPNIEIDSYEKLIVSSEGNLVIGGYAQPLIRDEYAIMDGGAYLLTINSNLEKLYSWNNVGDYHHLNVGSAIELSNERFAIVGQSTEGGQPSISIVNKNGTEHRYFYGSDSWYSRPVNLFPNNSGGFYGFFRDDEKYASNPMQIIEFNENAIPVNTRYLLEEGGYTSEAGLIRNNDSSLTILFGAGQNEYNNYDVVIKRVPFEN